MSSIANAFKRAAGVPEKDITNEIATPYYGRKIIAEAVIEKLGDKEDYIEVHNQFGYTDYGIYDAGIFVPVCNGCGALKMANRGEGTCCDNCNLNALNEMRHDDPGF